MSAVKKVALSLLIIAASAAYVWQQHLTATAPSQLDAELLGDEAAPNPSSSPAAVRGGFTPAVFMIPAPEGPAFGASPAAFIRTASVTAAGAFVDGQYTGPAVNAYYGLVQIQATVTGGRLVSIKVLKYPSDRQTSVSINRQALPLLRDEVIAAQSANVDIISGATLTSEAFIKSLGGALSQAH